jgi:hypothetical protein
VFNQISSNYRDKQGYIQADYLGSLEACAHDSYSKARSSFPVAATKQNENPKFYRHINNDWLKTTRKSNSPSAIKVTAANGLT